ncbi:uncharacterized protein LOC129582734 [Paramacrobiotus metropolitanus]|uniref:uncharacterized protein LOC129582734 n=1 Tax=Paramacrobiotus metropolitanus TaxID=2943436 RepID=UPI0024462C42|nr:uncharacterized protein LOC129582734 [Paramacrobiotus metropolitanus]
MASYLSIYNDTNDTWYIKLSHDDKALKGAGILLTALGTVSSLGALAGECTASGKKLGINKTATAAAVVAGSSAVVAGSAALVSSGKSMEWTRLAVEDLDKEGAEREVFRLAPGDTKQFGKFSLSLWKQCVAIRHRINPEDSDEVLVESVMMRPIFSGATNGSDKMYNIKQWLDKEGVTVLHRIRRPESWK